MEPRLPSLMLVPDSRLIITTKSDPTFAEIIISGTSTKNTAPHSYSFDYRELLDPKEFIAKKTGFISNTSYKVSSRITTDKITGTGRIIYTIIKRVGNRTDVQQLVASGPSSVLALDFPLNQDSIPVDIPENNIREYIIEFEVNMPSDSSFKYLTSDGQTGTLVNNSDISVIIKERLEGQLAWIEIQQPQQSKSKLNVKYSITDSGSTRVSEFTDDVRKILRIGTTKIKVDVDKGVDIIAGQTPIVAVENDNLEYNISSNGSVDISYISENTDRVSYSIGNIVRDAESSGVIKLYQSDFPNGIGQYTLILQPISNQNGSGLIKRVNINVVSKTYLPGPDITKINYPYNIKGADFRGYDENFKISWQSVNTNYIEVYVSKKSSEFSLAKVAGSGALTLNVANVLRKSKQSFNDSDKTLTFDLILIPYNTEGNSVVSGKQEKITIVFDKSDLKLKRNQVLRDIRTSFELGFNEDTLREQTSRFLTHLAHFGDGDNKLISTWGIDTETFSVYETDSETSQRRRVEFNPSLVLKLYEPLPTSVQPNQQLWVSKAQTLPTIEQIILTDDEVKSCIDLQPNFGLDISDDIGYQILDDLVASGSVSSTQLIQQYIGDNEFSLQKLDLQFDTGSDYAWENFVKYSSAAERIENFVYKVQLLEFYSASIFTLQSGSDAGVVSVINEISRTNEKIISTKQGFDAFENHIYTVDSPISYPGAGQNEISSSNSTDVTSWYNFAIGSARSFDEYNVDKLTNNIPQHFVNDANGQDYMLFFNMIGQHFDILWSYIRKFSKSKQLEHTNKGGITDELVYHMLESLGWDADMGVKSQVLWEYAFGKNKDGSSASIMTGKERQQEVWRRLLNNLPYIYKHKGTKRALNAAMACYGIPTSMLTIMEFGGPKDPTTSGTSKFTFDDRTAAINFDGAANILVPWLNVTGEFPQSLEFRINTDKRQPHTIASSERWELNIIPNTGSLAIVEFKISTGGVLGSGNDVSASTLPMPIFNDVYTQIAINRSVTDTTQSFDLYVKEGFQERIRNSGYATVEFPSSSIGAWQGYSEISIGDGFNGTMDEFRLWRTPLSESRVDNHTLLPDAIDGNQFNSSTEDLLFRLDFEYPKDRSSDIGIKNVSINRLYGNGFATASDFPSVPDYPYQYTPYERTVTANVPSTGMFVSNKIRFESHTLDNYLNFGTISNAQSFDSAHDSNKLGLFFSPSQQINLDILRSLGKFNIDNYIGNPVDEFSDTYSDLDELRNYYFQRYDLNIYEYIQLVRYIDQTLFTTLKSLVPGRSIVSSGLLIEPHILERSKISRKPVIAENIGLQSTTDVNEKLNMTSENIMEEVTLNTMEEISMVSENLQWDGNVNANDEVQLYAVTPFYDGTIHARDKEDVSGEYRTWDSSIDAKFTGSIQGEYESNQLTAIGMDKDSVTRAGFGIYAENGITIRTTIDEFGNRIQRRQRVHMVTEQHTVDVPVNINPLDPSLGSELLQQTYEKTKVTFRNYNESGSLITGAVIRAIPLNGYFPSHYRNVGDLTTGLQNSYYNGCKQTINTTLDGSSPIQIFTTNPNTLRVSDTGRGSGEPILEVD